MCLKEKLKKKKDSQNDRLSKTDLYLLTPKSKFWFLIKGNYLLCFTIRK